MNALACFQMHDDGTMYRRDDSLEFARAHGIPIVPGLACGYALTGRKLSTDGAHRTCEVTVQQIIAYRRQNGARAPPSVFEARTFIAIDKMIFEDCLP